MRIKHRAAVIAAAAAVRTAAVLAAAGTAIAWLMIHVAAQATP